VGVSAAGVGLMIGRRHNGYRRLLKYNPRQDCIVGFAASSVRIISVHCDASGFAMPELKPGAVSGFLGLDVRSSLAGSIADPSVLIEATGFRDEQTLDRGVRGVRFLNVSRLLAYGVNAGRIVKLRGKRLSWRDGPARLHVCEECVKGEEQVLVVAPHPDDAEIAAFGLYADTHATVVTVTSGDASDRYTGAGGMSVRLPRATVARMRVWDSITVPQHGGVGPEQALNLCYPDGCLQTMRADPECDCRGAGEEALDFFSLRKMNRSALLRTNAACTWKSLVHDLAHILAAVKPTVIVTPHPWLDPHLDHQYTTAAVCEAVAATACPGVRFYFYVNHNRRTELWPFGPAHSGVAMLPLLPSDLVDCEGFYSHSLSAKRQQEKFLSLEAMHDLRDLSLPEPRPVGVHLRRMRNEAATAFDGLGNPPTTYSRRAVRPDELFFTTSFSKAVELCARTLGEMEWGS
jgi:LmbE family N-acetylglucosaminyl deacetylase